MSTHSTLKKIQKSYELDISIRGTYIISSITIEMLISYIISEFFLSQSEMKHDLFFSLILNHREFTFSMKYEIFKKLLKSKYNDLFEKHSKNINKIENVMKLRNKLAHCYFEEQDSIDAPEDTIILTTYKNGKKEKLTLTNSEMKKEYNESVQIVASLLDIRNKIGES